MHMRVRSSFFCACIGNRQPCGYWSATSETDLTPKSLSLIPQSVACKDESELLFSVLNQRGIKGGAIRRAGPIRKQATDCPLDRNELGRATWGFLHTTAANYPEKPTCEKIKKANGLLEGVADLYACTYCAEDFQENLKRQPPALSSRTEFSEWLCMQHNLVNIKLGKPEFKCNISELDVRWKTGKPECWKVITDEPGT